MLRLSQTRVVERVAQALAPEEALRRFNRIAVLGDPGAGKTTMLRHLAFRSARGELGEQLTLPVYIELRRSVDSGLADLLEFAAADWSERYGFTDARPYLEQELAAGRSALLLDGLDEVLGGDTIEAATVAYNRVTEEVARLATRFPGAPIAVTCRRAGWRGNLTAFQTLEVLDFSWDQIQVFVNNWFAGDPAKGDGLRRALTGDLRMQTMAANPLILSLIAIVYDQELELPERRAQLYHRCVEVLLKEWDAHRNIRRFARFTPDRKRDLLDEIAWHFHQRGWRYFPESELLALVAEFLPTIALSADDAAEILDEIAAHYGLLKVQAQGWYGFLHLTLQEYFAAVAANERGTEALDLVIRNRHDPWWQEVVLLLSGRMTDATPLLLGILGRSAQAAPPPPTRAWPPTTTCSTATSCWPAAAWWEPRASARRGCGSGSSVKYGSSYSGRRRPAIRRRPAACSPRSAANRSPRSCCGSCGTRRRPRSRLPSSASGTPPSHRACSRYCREPPR